MLTIKRAYKNEFKQLLSTIRLCILNNRHYVAFSKKKFNYSGILNQLQTEGLIENFEVRGDLIILGLKQTHWKSFQNSMRAFTSIESIRLNKWSTGSYKQITKLQNFGGKNVFLSVSTDRGIMTGIQASTKKIGGLPLFKIL